MSRYRLYPTPEQEELLLRHCSDARYVWNLAVEQHAWWHPGRKSAPGYIAQSRQLTEARADNAWLRAGSATVQHQALRDFNQSLSNFLRGTHPRPTWRKRGHVEGFRIVGRRGSSDGSAWDVRRLNRNWAVVRVAKVGWVRFRWSRDVPASAKSFRVTRDRSGRWHVAFAVIPKSVEGPGTGEVVGVDRGVAVSAALSTGELLTVPGLTECEKRKFVRLRRRLAKAKEGSNRRQKIKAAAARIKSRETGRRKHWVEKTSTDLARRFDVIKVEALPVEKMTRRPKPKPSGDGTFARNGAAAKAGLNRGIQQSGWGARVRRLEDKAPGRVERVPYAFTSQTCSACGHVARENRESQAVFKCTACGYACNADANAAINIAAGHAVNARRGDGNARPVTREPQLALSG